MSTLHGGTVELYKGLNGMQIYVAEKKVVLLPDCASGDWTLEVGLPEPDGSVPLHAHWLCGDFAVEVTVGLDDYPGRPALDTRSLQLLWKLHYDKGLERGQWYASAIAEGRAKVLCVPCGYDDAGAGYRVFAELSAGCEAGLKEDELLEDSLPTSQLELVVGAEELQDALVRAERAVVEWLRDR